MKKEPTSLIAIIIFYSTATGIQSKLAFSKEWLHCNIITYDGSDWIMLDFDKSGFKTRKINCKNGNQLIKSIRVVQSVSATVTVSINDPVEIAWKPFIVRSCNEICRYAAGIDIGWTFNPAHFYRKLLKYRHTRNYEVLSAWRRKHGIPRGRQRSQ